MPRRAASLLNRPVLITIGGLLVFLGLLAATLSLAQGGTPGYAALRLMLLGAAFLLFGYFRRPRRTR
ncbi:hypothetical protein [Rothia halotolerans]|uniref:hypothetical protein n=1 Tax=Rothia halotolerans TaxID=405770 RepID=UPI00101DD8F9|nr:hypothetical protein [Rothia halotolerans]